MAFNACVNELLMIKMHTKMFAFKITKLVSSIDSFEFPQKWECKMNQVVSPTVLSSIIVKLKDLQYYCLRSRVLITIIIYYQYNK